jgi:hypothetical protein
MDQINTAWTYEYHSTGLILGLYARSGDISASIEVGTFPDLRSNYTNSYRTLLTTDVPHTLIRAATEWKKMIVFKNIWNVIPCNLGDHYRRFGRTVKTIYGRQHDTEYSNLHRHRYEKFNSRCQDFRVGSPTLLQSQTETFLLTPRKSVSRVTTGSSRSSEHLRCWREFVKRNIVMRVAIFLTFPKNKTAEGKKPRRTAGKRFLV